MGINILTVISFSEPLEIIAFNEKGLNKRIFQRGKKLLVYEVTKIFFYVNRRQICWRIKEEFYL